MCKTKFCIAGLKKVVVNCTPGGWDPHLWRNGLGKIVIAFD